MQPTSSILKIKTVESRSAMSDGLDLSTVEIHNSQDVKSWPATAAITRLEFRASGVHVEHTKNVGPGAWPNFRPAGWDGDLQYTLWMFLRINGQWHGAGGIQFWQTCDQNGGPPEEFTKNWFYAADRWAPMTGHQPASGESVGFMVSAGDARGDGQHPVNERSNIVVMPFPSSGAVYTATDAPEPALPQPQPPQEVPGPVASGPGPGDPLPQLSDRQVLLTTRDEVIAVKQLLGELQADTQGVKAALAGLDVKGLLAVVSAVRDQLDRGFESPKLPVVGAIKLRPVQKKETA